MKECQKEKRKKTQWHWYNFKRDCFFFLLLLLQIITTLCIKFSLLTEFELTKITEDVRYVGTKKVRYLWLVYRFEMTCELYHHERTLLGIWVWRETILSAYVC